MISLCVCVSGIERDLVVSNSFPFPFPSPNPPTNTQGQTYMIITSYLSYHMEGTGSSVSTPRRMSSRACPHTVQHRRLLDVCRPAVLVRLTSSIWPIPLHERALEVTVYTRTAEALSSLSGASVRSSVDKWVPCSGILFLGLCPACLKDCHVTPLFPSR